MITRGPYSRTATRRAHPRKISKLPDPPAQQVERQAEPGVQPACFRFALTGNRQELEVPAAGSALQCADYGARIVVGPGDIHRLAVLTEGDGAWAGPRTEMLLGGGEVRVRVKAQTARVLDGTEHHLASQLDGHLKRITVESREEVADETAQAKIVHDFRAESVFHPEAVDVGQVAADRDLAVPMPASHQHRGQAVGPGCRILLQRPSGMIADGQASTPGRADPAAGQRGPGRFGLHQDGRRADQAVRLGGPYPQRTGDLLRGLSPFPQQTYAFEALIGLHRNRS